MRSSSSGLVTLIPTRSPYARKAMPAAHPRRSSFSSQEEGRRSRGITNISGSPWNARGAAGRLGLGPGTRLAARCPVRAQHVAMLCAPVTGD